MAKRKNWSGESRKLSYGERVAERKMNSLDYQAEYQAWKIENKISNSRKNKNSKKYNKDLRYLDMGVNGPVEYRNRLLYKDQVTVKSPNELIRDRQGLRSLTTETVKKDKSGVDWLAGLEKSSGSKYSQYQFGKDGWLTSKYSERVDGSFQEEWGRDERGDLIRTHLYTERKRDGALISPISEHMSKPDANGYRTLTRTQGSKTKVFERDKYGNLTLVGRQSPTFSKSVSRSPERKYTSTDIRHPGGIMSKSYLSRIDPSGSSIINDITSRRVLWDKKSNDYYSNGQISNTKHTFGKLYKSEVEYIGDDKKRITKTRLGIKTSVKIADLSESELEIQALRTDAKEQHEAVWKTKEARRQAGPVAHALPQPGTTQRLGNYRADGVALPRLYTDKPLPATPIPARQGNGAPTSVEDEMERYFGAAAGVDESVTNSGASPRQPTPSREFHDLSVATQGFTVPTGGKGSRQSTPSSVSEADDLDFAMAQEEVRGAGARQPTPSREFHDLSVATQGFTVPTGGKGSRQSTPSSVSEADDLDFAMAQEEVRGAGARQPTPSREFHDLSVATQGFTVPTGGKGSRQSTPSSVSEADDLDFAMAQEEVRGAGARQPTPSREFHDLSVATQGFMVPTGGKGSRQSTPSSEFDDLDLAMQGEARGTVARNVSEDAASRAGLDDRSRASSRAD